MKEATVAGHFNIVVY